MDRPHEHLAGPRRTPARAVYTLSLEAHRRRGWRRVTVALWSAASMLALGFFGSPSIGEWVVRRRDDGREVQRIDAGADEEASILRSELYRQLDELSAEEFEERWSLERRSEPGRT